MKELYIVVNDNDGSPHDRIEFAFLNKIEADKYAEILEKESNINNYWVQTIYLYDYIDEYGKCLACGQQMI